MAPNTTCGRCGAARSSPSAPCPACLLALALDGDRAESATVSGPPPGLVRADGRRPALIPDQQLGRYAIERLLGRGGMGEVYAARQIDEGRRVAVKLLSGRMAPSDRTRFLREGQLAASIDHPNSVYVFGSEEIDGTPVIVMELLAGGTLKDRVERDGPLAPADAVDAILQVISGLDAAFQAGILHRDVKPSNCFVDLEGTIKIGDFGLSISTLARDMQTLSEAGLVQGTPQFAAPEQLRGEPLDVRADIYAVGGTLHYLMTGRAPFEASNLASLVSHVLTTPPPPASSLRRGIPRELDAILARCLSKSPNRRPANHRELYDALRSFSSEEPAPAPLPVRTAAGAIDLLLLLPLTGALVFGSYRVSVAAHALGFGAMILYFAVPEAAIGKSPGKWVCGLQVTESQGWRAPGFGRSLGRSLLFASVWHLSAVALFAVDRFTDGGLAAVLRLPSLLLTYAGLAVLFSTARARARVIALHDRVTSTRVVSRPPTTAFELPPLDIEPALVPDVGSYGPYRAVGAFEVVEGGRLVVASDDALRRLVWIRVQAAEAPPVPPGRRELARPTRLRWLTGARTPTAAWDAYEAPTGAALGALPAAARSWRLMRRWLADLAQEIERSAEEGTLPPLSTDRVWITRRGRAKLVDVTGGDISAADQTATADAQRFLAAVARSAGEFDEGAGQLPLPQSAQRTLGQLEAAAFASIEEARAALERLLDTPDHVSRRRRAASILLPGGLLVFQAASVAVALGMMRGWPFGSTLLGHLALFGAISALTAWLSRGGVVLGAWQIAVSRFEGSPVSRPSAMLRSAAAWSPILAASAVVFGTDLEPAFEQALALTAVLCWLAGAAYAVYRPQRGLQDRISGTWLVPR